MELWREADIPSNIENVWCIISVVYGVSIPEGDPWDEKGRRSTYYCPISPFMHLTKPVNHDVNKKWEIYVLLDIFKE